MTPQTFSSRMLACWFALFVAAAIQLAPQNAFAHPLPSEAIERPCNINQGDDTASLIRARCAFFVAAGYLIFQLDTAAEDKDAPPRTFSGAINLAQSTGSVFFSDGTELANGTVRVADQSPEIVHMPPGALATWDNGYVLEVSGTPAASEAMGAVVAQQNTGMAGQQDTETVVEVVINYIELGFLHIIPRGFDHILFVIGLFLMSPGRKQLIWQISAFTIAHTLTLGLGATGAVRLPANIVEPLIALSIVWVGVENLLTNKHYRWRIVVVFCFGLLHGLGFAGVLREIGLSGAHFYVALVSFNLGVELGQLTVIVLCFLVVGWAMRHSGYYRRVVVPASCVITIVAAYWVLQRTGVYQWDAIFS